MESKPKEVNHEKLLNNIIIWDILIFITYLNGQRSREANIKSKTRNYINARIDIP